MQYGFNPAYAIDGRDTRILGKLNYNTMRVIGAGAYTVVLSDDTYAIKIGSISRKSIRAMDFAYNQGFSVPVYFFRQKYKINRKLLNILCNSKIKSFGSNSYWYRYIDNNHADIAIVGLAQSFIDHYYYDSDREEEYMQVVYKVRNSYLARTGKYWNDAHEGNIGYYNDSLVILDF